MPTKLCTLLALPALALLALAPLSASAQNKPTKATPTVQKEFDGFIAGFRKALKSNDAAAITTMTRTPFYYDDKMLDAAQFRSKAYPFYFTAKTRACLQKSKTVYDRDGENNDSFSIFCDDSIFVFTKTKDGFKFTDVSVND